MKSISTFKELRVRIEDPQVVIHLVLLENVPNSFRRSFRR